MTEVSWNARDEKEVKVAMEKFLDDVGWGALLVTVGTLWLVPTGQLPRGTWMIAVGLILLVLNVARYMLRIQVNWFTVVAGTVALLAGIGAAFTIELPIFPIALVVIGLCLLVDSVRKNLHQPPDREHDKCC